MSVVLRGDAVKLTVEEFVGRPVDWANVDCVRIFQKHLENMGRPERLKAPMKWTTEGGALRAFAREGHEDLEAAIDSYGFEKIPSSHVLAGDLYGLPAEKPWGVSLAVALGAGRALMLAFGKIVVANAHLHLPVEMVHLKTVAWRVPPCPK